MKKLLIFSAILSIFISCKGPQGEIGPKGDTGSQGIAGPQGPASGDIFHSEWIGIGGSFGSGSKINTITAPEITSEVLNKYILLVYVKPFFLDDLTQGVRTDLTLLPFIVTSDGKVVVSITYRAEKGKLTVTSFPAGNGWAYRYVIIKGGTLIPKGAKKSPIDYSNYEVVKKAYNIPD